MILFFLRTIELLNLLLFRFHKRILIIILNNHTLLTFLFLIIITIILTNFLLKNFHLLINSYNIFSLRICLIRYNDGYSFIQDGHQEPQKCTNTTVPSRSEITISFPRAYGTKDKASSSFETMDATSKTSKVRGGIIKRTLWWIPSRARIMPFLLILWMTNWAISTEGNPVALSQTISMACRRPTPLTLPIYLCLFSPYFVGFSNGGKS